MMFENTHIITTAHLKSNLYTQMASEDVNH